MELLATEPLVVNTMGWSAHQIAPLTKHMITTTIETSKLLKEAKFPQENNQFVWVENNFLANYLGKYSIMQSQSGINKEEIVAASPTADEILELLPDRIQLNNLTYGFRLWIVDYTKHVRHYCCNYFVMDHGKKGRLIGRDFIIEQSAAEALGKLYLWLDENNLLTNIV